MPVHDNTMRRTDTFLLGVKSRKNVSLVLSLQWTGRLLCSFQTKDYLLPNQRLLAENCDDGHATRRKADVQVDARERVMNAAL